MKHEIKRVLTNRYFTCICFLEIIIVILHSCSKISEYSQLKIIFNNCVKNGQNPYFPITSSFTAWIGWDINNSYSKIILYLLPILAIISYSWSYCSECKSGYADYMINKYNEYRYHLYKYIGIFIASGTIVTIPLLTDFIIISMYIPSVTPDSVYDIYYGIFSNNFMADCFYIYPIVYVLTHILLRFIYCGLFGCIGYAVSTIVKSKIIAIATPILLLFITEYIKQKLSSTNDIFDCELSPLSIIIPVKSISTNWLIVSSEVLVIFLVTFSISVLRYKKRNGDKR